MTYCTKYETEALGALTLASDGDSITGLWLQDQKYFGASVDGPFEQRDDLPVFGLAQDWLDHYFADDPLPVADLPLAPHGTQFQQRVWAALRSIPYGELRTYGDIANRLAREDGKERGSARAVGVAVGRNPISIILPCHRVVGADGSLTGYAGGMQRKLWLLEHEHVDANALYVPKFSTAP